MSLAKLFTPARAEELESMSDEELRRYFEDKMRKIVVMFERAARVSEDEIDEILSFAKSVTGVEPIGFGVGAKLDREDLGSSTARFVLAFEIGKKSWRRKVVCRAVVPAKAVEAGMSYSKDAVLGTVSKYAEGWIYTDEKDWSRATISCTVRHEPLL